MAAHITLDVFSGRENPQWKLTRAQEGEFLRWLRATRELSLRKPPGLLGILGYRGFRVMVSQRGVRQEYYISGGIIDPGQRAPSRTTGSAELEQWLMATAPGDVIPGTVQPAFETRVRDFLRNPDRYHKPGNGCPACHAHDAPDYEPHLWNQLPMQEENNCYNYANNNPTDTFAQPGRGSGQIFTQLTCDNVGDAAVRDGLRRHPNFTDDLAAGEGWYVALAIWPNTDYHWWRQDRNGCWSHKPGETPVVNVGADGNPIHDPQVPATRGDYTTWCGYMIADEHTTID